MVSPDSRLGTVGIYIQYIYITKIVVLVSEPVRGRSRATELISYWWLILGVSKLLFVVPRITHVRVCPGRINIK